MVIAVKAAAYPARFMEQNTVCARGLIYSIQLLYIYMDELVNVQSL